ncbi:MAG: hypothetical protein HOP33_10975 [Verrucomicrobia bacterium]|nr:hypothetical protein [Verrucomicrobiota bacterium]
MKLNFSLNGIEQLWFAGELPFSKIQMDKVSVRFLSGQFPSSFPRNFNEVGELLTYNRNSPAEFAVTLLLTYVHKDVPLTHGQVRIALPMETLSQISSVSGEKHQYELKLENVELIDVSPTVKVSFSDERSVKL